MSTKQNKKNSQMHSRLQDIPIAIVGMSAIFPESKNLQDYWDNIVKEIDCIIDVPESRWNIEDYYDPDPKKEDKTYSKRGGFIPDIDFDPMEFGLPPNILEVTDVHQLLSLILAKEVLKDGGYESAPEELRKNTGVILGVGGSQKLMRTLVSRLQYPIWEKVLKSTGLSDSDTSTIVDKIKKAYVGWEENAFPGTLGNVIAGRIANRLDLNGTNCVVDAACASSLSGIRLAVSELLEYRADMMITGGVDTDNSPYTYLCFSKTQAFTASDKSSPFNADSDGMIMGEGIGMLLLKRLPDAERDNDRIYAIIKGIGSSSDGRYKSIYAPRSEGQVLALQRAYRDADIDPLSIGLLEAHGTGTTAGDLAEVEALKGFFNINGSPNKQFIPMGSVKSQIGHTKNAAGAAGIIKTSLALYHKVLPATINITEPNKELDLENSPFYLNTSVRPWFHSNNEHPRRAGLSAFGFGGTNFHFIIEEYQQPTKEAYRLQKVCFPIILQAASPNELKEICSQTIQNLKGSDSQQNLEQLATDQYSTSIDQSNARLGFVADTPEEAIGLLEKAIEKLEASPDAAAWNLRKGVFYQKQGLDPKGKLVALFSGQGSPYLNMGKELICNFPPLLENQQFMDQLFIEDGLAPLSSILYPIPVFNKDKAKEQERFLQLTENAQPSIGVFSAGQYQLLKQAGFKPDFTAGHSFGELTALWAANVINDEDYFKLAKARGKAMAAPDDPDFDAGSMLAVMGELENLEEEIKEFSGVSIANFNSKNQVVLAGPTDEVKKAQEKLKDLYRTVLLKVSAAFHTEFVGHAQKPFAEDIEKATFRKPSCKVYSNATAKPYPQTPKSIQKVLKDHILNSVQFKQEIENIYDAGGRIFIEFGPQSILTRLVDNILEGKDFVSVALNANAKKPSDRQFREAVVKIKVAGVHLENYDPYCFQPAKLDKKRNALTLTISGSNYVSDKTKNAFESALKDGFTIQQNTTNDLSIAEPINTEKSTMSSTKKESPQNPQVQQGENQTCAMQSLERSLANFYNHQNETLRIHEQFLNNQSEYSKSFFQIMQQQAQAGNPSLSKEVSHSINQFHTHQSETLRVHEHYLRMQTEYSRNSFELIRQQQHSFVGGNLSEIPPTIVENNYQPPAYNPPKPIQIEPVNQEKTIAVQAVPQPEVEQPPQMETVPAVQPAKQSESINREALVSVLLNVVAEKTGYQSDMLELGMDMEADLGIDSIKRVEILNGIQEQMAELPQLNPEELAELRTLEQIVDYMNQQVGTPSDSQESINVETAVSSNVTSGDLVKVLLDVVSEKTGYQADMLEMDMDMEADLGIDSIKRVEILNGIQENLPNLPAVNPEELAELRTLQQIADYMTPDQNTVAPQVSVTPQTDAPKNNVGLEVISNAMLEVVSEKTGYLQDMLELSMDLEADLGIDSIKRVEILNGIQEKLPNLPEVNPEELAELRTLEQIIDKLNQTTASGAIEKTEPIKKKQISAESIVG